MLGKNWPFVTPDYLFNRMDLGDVKDMSAFLSKEEWAYCWVGGKQDLSKLKGIVNVKRG